MGLVGVMVKAAVRVRSVDERLVGECVDDKDVDGVLRKAKFWDDLVRVGGAVDCCCCCTC